MSKNVKIVVGIGALLILAMLLFIIFGGKKETFTVSFYTDGGTIIETQTVEEGERVSRPSNPTKDGYIFDNWYIGDDVYDFTIKITKNITLSAKWIKDNTDEDVNNEEVIAEKYTVTFNSNGGSNVESVVVEKGQKVSEPVKPTRKNYRFVSWQLNGKDYDFDEEVTSDITLIAKWKKVTTTNNTGSSNNNTNTGNNDSNNNNDNTDTGNNDNNNNDNTDTGNNDNNNNSSNEDETPVVPETPKSYTIKFDTTGGNTIANQNVEEGKTVTKPSDPKKEGYTFDGWYYNGTLYDFNTKVTADITLVANWTINPVISHKIVSTDSQVGQVILYVLRGEEKVDGIVDIKLINGTIVKDVEISKNGYVTNGLRIDTITNERVK